MPREAGLAPLAYVAAGGFVAAVSAQLVAGLTGRG